MLVGQTQGPTIQVSGSLTDSLGRAVELPVLIAEEGAVSTDGGDLTGAPPSSRFAAELEPGRYVVEVKLPSGVIVRRPLGALVWDTELEPWTLPDGRMQSLRVLDGDGQPVPGAQIRAASRWGGQPPNPLEPWRRSRAVRQLSAESRSVTDANGSARIWLPDSARHTVTLRADGWAARSLVLEVGTEAEILLERSTPRSFEVTDTRGKPAVGARVELGGVLLAETDETGTALIGLGTEEMVLHASSLSSSASLRVAPDRAPAEGSIAVRLQPNSVVAGSVVDAASGEPIERAVVWAEESPGDWQRTADDGSFELDTQTSQRGLTLRAAAAGFEAGELRIHGEAPVQLALRRSHSLTVLVLSPDGEPVPGAAVEVQTHNPWRMGVPWTATTTDAQGLATLPDLAQEALDVRARHPDFGQAEDRLSFSAAQAERRLTLQLAEGFRAFGTVTDAGGSPIEGVVVKLSALPQTPRRRMLWLDDHVVASAFSNAEGRFALPAAVRGRYDLFLLAEGYAPRRVSAVDLTEASTDLGAFTMNEGLRFEGRVLTEDGQAMQDATIRIQRPWQPELNILHDEGQVLPAIDGRFVAAGLGPGKHSVYAEAEGLVGASQTVDLPTDEPVELRLARGFTVQGRVEGANGQVLEASAVLMRGKHRAGYNDRTTKYTEGDGRYRLGPASLGTNYSVIFAAEGFQSVTHALEGTETATTLELDVVLEPGLTVTGRLVDERGQPVAAANVHVSPVSKKNDGALRRPLWSDGRGRFSIGGLSPEPYTLLVRASGFLEFAQEIDPTTADLGDFTLERGLSITGTVVDEDGEPVEGAHWIKRESNGFSGWGSSRGPNQRPTDSEGRFEISGLEPGFYQIQIVREGYAPANSPAVELVDRNLEGLEIRLTRGHTVTGEVTGLSVAELSQVSVYAFELHEGNFRTMNHPRVAVAEDGSFRLDNARTGYWRLHAKLDAEGGPRRAEQRIDVQGDTDGVELAFGDTVEVRGQVTLDGEPARGAIVSVSGATGEASTAADELGRFELIAPSGTAELVVRSRGARHLERLELFGDVDLEIALRSHALTVLVEDAEGRPVEGAALTVIDNAGNTKRVGGTGPDGFAEILLEERPEGPLQLLARDNEHGVGRITIPEGEVGGVVVLEARTTTPLRLIAPDGRSLELGRAWLEANGFVVEQLSPRGAAPLELSAPPGRYLLWVEAWESAAEPLWIDLPAEEITVQLQPAGFLVLRGRLGAWQSISARYRGQRHPAPAFRLEGGRSNPLVPGRWTIEVIDLIEGTTREIPVDVVAGDTAAIELP